MRCDKGQGKDHLSRGLSTKDQLVFDFLMIKKIIRILECGLSS
jgi:hypothetical protein